MGVACAVETDVRLHDPFAYPGFGMILARLRTSADHLFKRTVNRHGEAVGADHLAQ
jgi:hypothetical protein